MRTLKLLIVLYCLACGAVQAASVASMTEDVCMLVNQYRMQHGRSKLRLNTIISSIAEKHSIDMARHVVPVAHDGFELRMKNIRKKLPTVTSVAENVAYRYNTPKIVVDGWIHSPGHRRNILGNYSLTGIGIVRDAAGNYYYTQLFANENVGQHAVLSRSHRSHHRFRY